MLQAKPLRCLQRLRQLLPVRLNVPVQVTAVDEGLEAELALKRLLSCVLPGVTGERRLKRKRLGTVLTPERLLPRVYPYVARALPFVVEGLLAHIACVWLGLAVPSSVALQGGQRAVRLKALTALKRPLPGVGALVVPQGALAPEPCWAHRALEGPLARVDHGVLNPVVLPGEDTGAVLATELGLHVGGQVGRHGAWLLAAVLAEAALKPKILPGLRREVRLLQACVSVVVCIQRKRKVRILQALI